MKKLIIPAILCLICSATLSANTNCNLSNNQITNWLTQYQNCPASPTAAYNAILQSNAQGDRKQAQKLLQQGLQKFNTFQPLKQLSKDMQRWSQDPYQLISQLTDSALKKWVKNLPPPDPFLAEAPEREAMPALPQLVKDEFETTPQFKKRVEKARKKRQRHSERLERNYQAAVKNYNAKIEDYNRHLAKDKALRPQKIRAKQQTLLAENIALVLGKPMLRDLNYNADQELFYGRLVSSHDNFDQPVKFAVPLAQARSLKQDMAEITPLVDFMVNNDRLEVSTIIIPRGYIDYQAELTAEINSAPVLTAQLDDSQIKTAYTQLSTIQAGKADVNDDSAFFNTALSLEADPQLAKLKQQQAELARQQRAARQQQAVLAERERLQQQINQQQQALASLGGGLAADFKGLKPVITWAFKPAGNSAASSKDTVMVIIGNRNYAKGVPLVHYAHNDARAMREFARDSLGLLPENILYEQDATKGVMEGLFKSTLPARVKAGASNVLVYFSGHGMAANNDAKLLPVDARPNTAAVTGYSRNTLMQQLASLKVNSTVILDACYSGTSKSGTPLLAGKPVFKAPKQAWLPPKTTLISAASGNQIAWMDEQNGHSLMTYHLLKGLQGPADKNHNGRINSQELASWLKTSVNRSALKLHEQPQQPEVLGAKQVLVSY